MEGLGSSGRLVGSISTYPGTYKCPGSLVMAKNPGGGDFFLPCTYETEKVHDYKNSDYFNVTHFGS